MGHAKENAAIRVKGRCPCIELIVSFVGISSTGPPLIFPTDIRTSFKAFRNYRLPRQLVAFQKRFRLLELPLPEIRPEFDRNTSNAGMLPSGTPRQAGCQEFHRLSMRAVVFFHDNQEA